MSDVNIEYVTARVGGQLIGLPISRVQDVFRPKRLTRVPLADYEVAGVISLRGRIVTLLDLRRMLGFSEENGERLLAIGVEFGGEFYGLLIDRIGDVIRLRHSDRIDNPVNLDRRMARVAAGIHQLKDELMVVLDLDRLLGTQPLAA